MNIAHLDEYLRKPTEAELSNRVQYNSLLKELLAAHNPEFDELINQFESIPISDLSKLQNIAYYENMLQEFRYLDGVLVIKQDRYAEVAAHRHDWIELVYLYSGTCTLNVAGKEITLTKGQSLLINSGVVHSCQSCGEDDILINFLIMKGYLNQNFFNRFSEDSYLSQLFIRTMNDQNAKDNYIFFPSETSRRLPIFVTEFLCEYYDRSIHFKDYIDSYMTLILLELTDIFGRCLSREQQNGTKEHVIPLLRYIEENFLTCTLKSTAEFFNMNANYLSNYIKKYTGVTFKHLVQEQKLMYAANLLKNTGLPVTDVSSQAGYENVSFFYKKFADKYHCSPNEYRKVYCNHR